MGFFDDLSAETLRDDDQPPGPDWVEIGAPTSTRVILVHTEDLAVTLTGFVVTSSGFRFHVRVDRRVPPSVRVNFGFDVGGQLAAGDPSRFRLGVLYADGRKLTNLDPQAQIDDDTDAPALRELGGSAGGNPEDGWYAEGGVGVTPLPPPGAVIFACEWPVLGVPESTAAVDAGELLHAADEIVRLWQRTYQD